MVLPSSYLPPISWFTALISGEPILIEQHENYVKQSIRNRCTIDSPNGALNLSVPVDKSNFVMGKCQMKDVLISAHTDWQRQHWYALETSYFNSPFFEYLQDDFRPIYEREWRYLIDLNEALVAVCCDILEIEPLLSRTSRYEGLTLCGKKSVPSACSAGTGDTSVKSASSACRPYYQVFQQKHGFLPDLSIIDLIFNMGKEAVMVIGESLPEVKGETH